MVNVVVEAPDAQLFGEVADGSLDYGCGWVASWDDWSGSWFTRCFEWYQGDDSVDGGVMIRARWPSEPPPSSECAEAALALSCLVTAVMVS